MIYADTICDLGHAAALGNYGEYSGASTKDLTEKYAETAIKLLLASTCAATSLLLIGGGIANFTDVAATFAGIIAALKRYRELLCQRDSKQMGALAQCQGVTVLGPSTSSRATPAASTRAWPSAASASPAPPSTSTWCASRPRPAASCWCCSARWAARSSTRRWRRSRAGGCASRSSRASAPALLADGAAVSVRARPAAKKVDTGSGDKSDSDGDSDSSHEQKGTSQDSPSEAESDEKEVDCKGFGADDCNEQCYNGFYMYV